MFPKWSKPIDNQEKKEGFLRVFHVTKARCVVRKMGGQKVL